MRPLWFKAPLLLALAGCAQLPVDAIAVADWGGKVASAEVLARAKAHVATRLTLHHAGVVFKPGQDVRAYLVNLQNWSRNTRGWADIPYHYVIDFEGRVYEARSLGLAGDTNTAYDPSGHALVMLLGNLDEQLPTAEQRAALVRTLAQLSVAHGIDPATLSGHSNHAETACPGKHVQAWLADGSLLADVRAAVRSFKPSF